MKHLRGPALLAGGLLAFCASPALANPLEVPLPVQISGYDFSHATVFICGVVALLISVLCWLGTRNLSIENPSRGQMLLEMIIEFFDDLVRQSIGPNRGRIYLPYIGTLFLFIWTCNMIGMIPIPQMQIGGEQWEDFNHNHYYDPGEPYSDANSNGVHDPGFIVPPFEEPTANLNVPLGLALLFVVMIGHGSEIRIHGLLGYFKSYFSPGGAIGVIMFPLNVIGKIAEVVSISFRLFGNIFGGVVIISVVGGLLKYMILPIGLFGFFGVFVGTVQAFVFTMLALTYISMGASEEDDE